MSIGIGSGPSARPRHRAAGFTLIEVIVVVLVFSIMSVMAYGGLRSVLDTRRGIEASMQRSAELQRAFLRLRGDFQNLRDRPARDNYGDAQSPLVMDREGTLVFVRGGWRSPLQSARSSLERVRYRVEDGVLRRATWKAVDLPQDGEPSDLPLLRKVDEVRWRFLDASREWREQWPARAGGALGADEESLAAPPMAVEITLVTRDWGELRFVFRTPQAGLARGSSTAGDGTDAGDSSLLTREGLLPIEQLQVPASSPQTDGEDEEESTEEEPTAETPDPPSEDPGTGEVLDESGGGES